MIQRWEYSTKFAVYGTRFLVRDKSPSQNALKADPGAGAGAHGKCCFSVPHPVRCCRGSVKLTEIPGRRS